MIRGLDVVVLMLCCREKRAEMREVKKKKAQKKKERLQVQYFVTNSIALNIGLNQPYYKIDYAYLGLNQPYYRIDHAYWVEPTILQACMHVISI